MRKLLQPRQRRASGGAERDGCQPAFAAGRGLGWHEPHPTVFSGTARFFRPGHDAHLVPEWIPALDGADARLRKVAEEAGFGRFRRATQTPFNLVFEART